ncbi:MAG: NAD-binding protein [Halodesulfurarchaeum sp.]
MDTQRGALGGRAAITLTTLVGVLSIATGIANIGTNARLGILASVIPSWLSQIAGFSGVVTGFVLLVSAVGLRRGLRLAWYTTIVLFPVSAIQGIVQSSPFSVPLVVLSIVSLPTVLLNRRQFDRRLSLNTVQSAALLAIVGTLLYGSVGAYALRSEFAGISGVTDAIYFTLVTASTVGYGDVTPRTPMARFFGMTVIVIGTASFATAVGAVLAPAIEARLANTLGRMKENTFELLEDHVIVLGYGDLTEPLLEEFGDQPLVLVVNDQDTAAEFRRRGYDVQTGDPGDEDVLESVGIDTAQAVVAATNSDGDDALAILTARQLNQRVRIVGAATDRENVEKLRRAGAETVISPHTIGAHLLVQSALGDNRVEAIADRILDDTDDREHETEDNRTGE